MRSHWIYAAALITVLGAVVPSGADSPEEKLREEILELVDAADAVIVWRENTQLKKRIDVKLAQRVEIRRLKNSLAWLAPAVAMVPPRGLSSRVGEASGVDLMSGDKRLSILLEGDDRVQILLADGRSFRANLENGLFYAEVKARLPAADAGGDTRAQGAMQSTLEPLGSWWRDRRMMPGMDVVCVPRDERHIYAADLRNSQIRIFQLVGPHGTGIVEAGILGLPPFETGLAGQRKLELQALEGMRAFATAADGQQIYVLRGPNQLLCLNRDVKTGMLSCANDATSLMQSPELEGADQLLCHPRREYVVALAGPTQRIVVAQRAAQDGLRVVSGCAGGDADNPPNVVRVTELLKPQLATFSPDGKILYVASFAGLTTNLLAFAFDEETGKLVFAGQAEPPGSDAQALWSPLSISVTPDGAVLFYATRSGKVHTFECNRQTGELRHCDTVTSKMLAISGLERFAISSDAKNVVMFTQRCEEIIVCPLDKRSINFAHAWRAKTESRPEFRMLRDTRSLTPMAAGKFLVNTAGHLGMVKLSVLARVSDSP